jgi:hypothetical protein
MNIEFFHINLNLASAKNFECSDFLFDSWKDSCIQVVQSLPQVLELFFAVIAIVFVFATIRSAINGTILYQSILWSICGILISYLMGLDYTLDIILLILSVVTVVIGEFAMLISLLIVGYNVLKIFIILQSIQ